VRKYLAALFLCHCGGGLSGQASLERALADVDRLGATTAALVVDAEDGTVLYARRPEARLLPASTMKLVATLFALDTLGPDFRFITRALLGPGDAGEADVCLDATGDPSFGGRRFEETEGAVDALADRIALLGVRSWRGALALCTPADDPPLGPGWAWDDAGLSYSARPTRFVAFENAFTLRLFGDGKAAQVQGDELSRLGLLLHVRFDASADDLSCRRPWGSPAVDCAMPARPGVYDTEVSIDDPLALLGVRLEDALRSRGVAWTRRLGPPPRTLAGFRPLHEVESPPLKELARVTNQISINLYAERLALAAAERASGRAGYAAYQQAVSTWLAGLLVSPNDATIVDGSGLSRLNALTPRALVQLLRAALGRPSGAPWLSGLAIAGASGTLKRRGAAAQGLVFAKTGTLSHQRAIAGLAYRDKATRHRAVFFAFLVGNHPGDTAATNRLLDAIMAALVE
jgi:D-alanyl-D-alanine carboxypeptidase/D-alanyl-D-alanine-endopeptidase (penicillin-binding protein 4)